MENASKALIMAGSILIALLTIGALVFMFDSISEVEQQKDQNAEIDAVLEFNRQFEAFDTVGLRGTDILSAINKMVDYNESNDVQVEGYPEMSMKITFVQNFKKPDGISNISANTTIEWDDLITEWYDIWYSKNSKDNTVTAQEQLLEFKRKYFKCTNIEYDNNTGRVIKMEFKEIKVQ